MTANKIPGDLYIMEANVADPGDAKSIIVNKSLATCNLVSLTSETRTLDRPTKQGVLLTLHMKTDGGDITLTVTGGYNEDGDTSFTFSEPGQFIMFASFFDGTNYYWRKITDYASANVPAAAAAILDAFGSLTATVTELNRSSDTSTRVVAIGPSDSATLAITELAHDGKTIYLTKTDGWNATLPVPVAGMKFRIIIGATIATASTIKSVAGTHLMFGHALMGNDSNNSVVDFPAVAASTLDTIDLLGTGNSTGGVEGQEINIEAMSATRWFVSMRGDAAGTEATPFSDTVT